MKKLSLWLSAISLLSLVNCASMSPPPDVPTCEHLKQYTYVDPKTGDTMLKPDPTCMSVMGEPECGHCVTITSATEFYIGEQKKFQYNNKPWSKLRASSIYLPAQESYAPLAAYIINTCKTFNCSTDVERFKVKIDSLNGIEALINGNSGQSK